MLFPARCLVARQERCVCCAVALAVSGAVRRSSIGLSPSSYGSAQANSDTPRLPFRSRERMMPNARLCSPGRVGSVRIGRPVADSGVVSKSRGRSSRCTKLQRTSGCCEFGCAVSSNQGSNGKARAKCGGEPGGGDKTSCKLCRALVVDPHEIGLDRLARDGGWEEGKDPT